MEHMMYMMMIMNIVILKFFYFGFISIKKNEQNFTKFIKKFKENLIKD